MSDAGRVARGDLVFEAAQGAPPSPLRLPCVPSWSLPNGFTSCDLGENQPLPRALGDQQVTYQSVGPGCGVFHARVKLNETVHFSAMMMSERPIAVLRLPRAGKVEVGFRGAGTVVENRDIYGFFLHSQLDSAVEMVHQPATPCDTVVTMFSEDRLSSMLAGTRVPKSVERFLNGDTANVTFSLGMSAAMRSLASQLISSPYSSDLAPLYLNAKFLEAMAATLNDLNGTEESSRSPSRGENARFAAVIDLLLANLAAPPTIEALARSVGLTQRQLAEFFKLQTGRTIAEWVFEKKVEHAATMLRQGDMSIKEISFHLGYTHVGTFTSQFAKKLGVPPAEYRRSQRSFCSNSRKSA
jgi:AraC-like DNA-binding protein